jgi:hypothetical protein
MLRVSQAADMSRRMADTTQDPELSKFHALGAVMDRTTIIIILVLVLGGWLVRHGRCSSAIQKQSAKFFKSDPQWVLTFERARPS